MVRPRIGRYIPVRQLTGMRIARYRVVPPGNNYFRMRNRPVRVDFDRRRPISSGLGRGREKEEEERSQPRGGERRGEEEENLDFFPRIDDSTEVSFLRYHGATKPMVLLSIALHLRPFLRDR
ncbi:hypothetical protein B296_00009799 [Ensete ventricosum]|uniref:Uncharacterized protein n=1 Tax=Ensete ventricosum TaxID=4639 RepID=A0A427AGD0_ENSVE|nr:hypothetical protein B296_00009799 [Ensete ventricosum]